MTLTHTRNAARLATVAVLLAVASLAGLPVLAQNNDACANPAVVPGAGPFPYAVSRDTRAYGDDALDPVFSCKGGKQGPVGKTAWFTFTPSVTDNYRIDTAGTVSATPSEPYDTILSVYTGTCASLVPVANGCADDASGSLLAGTSLALTAGQTYTIVVGGIGEIDFFTGAAKPTKGGTLLLTVSQVQVTYPYRYVIPSVARAQGATLYVSDLNVTNLEPAEGQFTVQFLGHGNDGDQSPPASQPTLPNPIPLGIFGGKEIPDVVGSSAGFGLSNDYGALSIKSTRRLSVGARTYTDAAGGGTFGQFAAGIDVSSGATSPELLQPNEAGRIIGIRDDNTPGAGFRTNVVLVNASSRSCTVLVEAHDQNGTLLGQSNPVVPPNTMLQKSLRGFVPTAPAVRGGAVRVVVPSDATGCQIGGVGYVIDSTSQDPFAVPLRK